ncbi:MlaA family lipoprotein [Azonexus hydrophilus]|uniref:MlaA family lipoprotein n=1 Tax=Azonexus hydrophilus TaxID=418702 RepID=UPI00041A520E|nr:VacJ family lipoprotein [Azonexus hydrophilus]
MTLQAGDSIRRLKRLLVLGGALLVAAQVGAQDKQRDPFEGFNRTMYSVNEVLDQYAARPVAQAYDAAVPLPVKASVGNVFGNVGEVWVGANSALQGKGGDAGITLARLLINSTVGILGLFDVASEMGLERYNEDFGQTLAVWGVSDGPYLFLPVIGPRTSRDFAGWAVDTYADPVRSIRSSNERLSATVVRFVDIRAGLLPADRLVEEAALDKYSYVRDAYLQRRRNLIYDGRPPRMDD